MTTQEKSPDQRLLEVQKEIGAIKKDKKNPHFKNTYADINNVLGAIKPILNKHGFTVWQPLTLEAISETGKPINSLTTTITDSESGETALSSKVLLPDLENPQHMGGAITYFRRYALQSLLSLEAEDDDGNAASGNKTSGVKPVKHMIPVAEREIVGECKECGGNVAKTMWGTNSKGKWELYNCDKNPKEHSVFNEFTSLINTDKLNF